MCYTGGPRCSSHVAEELAKIDLELETAIQLNDMDRYEAAHEKLDRLQMEMNSTPAGQKALQAELDALQREGDLNSMPQVAAILETAQMLREHDMNQRRLRMQSGEKLERGCNKTQELKNEEAIIREMDKEFGVDTLKKEEKPAPLTGLSREKDLVTVQTPTMTYSDYESSIIPQANDIEKISSLVESIESGATTATSIGESLNMDNRGGNYYANAAEYLGLVSKHESAYDGGFEYELTDNGKIVMGASSTDRAQHIRNMVNATPLMRVYHENDRDKEAVINAIIDMGHEEKTAARRASVVCSWDETVNSKSFVDKLDKSHEETAVRSLVAADKLKKSRDGLKLKTKEPDDTKRQMCQGCWYLKPLSGECDNCD